MASRGHGLRWVPLHTRQVHLRHASVLPLSAAIYLAKRNIRKKGILEMHEQVRTRAAELPTVFAAIHSAGV